ncbi:hypothetical protein DB354_09945 [Opitutus sp. ER46]|nr:hypothetical protein DB354_09945 [Opitutus sp. ER46]
MVMALVPVVLVEWFVARRQFCIPSKMAAKGVIAANCCSTLLGFPLFWLSGVLGIVLLGERLDEAIPSAWIFARRSMETGVAVFWLGPDVDSEKIMRAGCSMLPLAFVVSVTSERWILRRTWPQMPPAALWRYAWLANLLSYPVLIVIWLWYLVWVW